MLRLCTLCTKKLHGPAYQLLQSVDAAICYKQHARADAVSVLHCALLSHACNACNSLECTAVAA